MNDLMQYRLFAINQYESIYQCHYSEVLVDLDNVKEKLHDLYNRSSVNGAVALAREREIQELENKRSQLIEHQQVLFGLIQTLEAMKSDLNLKDRYPCDDDVVVDDVVVDNSKKGHYC